MKFPSNIIYCYHRVLPEEIAKRQFVHRSLYVTPETFEKQIIWMAQNGTICDIEELFKSTPGNKSVITFDDGWKDNLTYAFPILKKYSIPFILFIPTFNIQENVLFWSEEFCIQLSNGLKKKKVEDVKEIILDIMSSYTNRIQIKSWKEYASKIKLSDFIHIVIELLKKQDTQSRNIVLAGIYDELDLPPRVRSQPYLLSWEEIIYLKTHGATIGSHTHTHALLPKLSKDKIYEEIFKSKKTLEEKLDETVDSFSYPNGFFQNNHIQKCLKNIGYKFGFTLQKKSNLGNNLFLLPRWLLYEHLGSNLQKMFIKEKVKKCFLSFARKF